MKKCDKCGEELAADKFKKNPENEDKRDNTCMQCLGIEPEKTKKTKKKVMTRVQSMALLTDYNVPFDAKETDAELAEKAGAIVPEKFYRCEIMESGKTKVPAWTKVDGKKKFFKRGEEVIIRQRYLDSLMAKYTVLGDAADGTPKKHQEQREVIQILGEVPESEVALTDF